MRRWVRSVRNGTVIETKEALVQNGVADATFDSHRLPNQTYTVEAVFRGQRGTSPPLTFIDLDIDSDNSKSGFYDFNSAGSDWEETLEDSSYALGKLIEVGSFPRLEILLPKGLDKYDPNIRIRFDWTDIGPAGKVSLWRRGAQVPREVGDGFGDQIIPGHDYSILKLNYDPENGRIIFFAHGQRENSQTRTLAGVERLDKPTDTIRATLLMNGRDVAHDDVKYAVVSENSFLYQLQTRKEVRYALAARGAYADPQSGLQQDMPKFGLKLLDEKELIKRGVPADIRTLLGPADQNGVAGFSAALYQDFVAGEERFVLALAGTDDNVWAGEWTDWITNVAQGLGQYAAQYRAAMRISNALVNLTPGITSGHLITTGQSLGGGLSSAAAVAGDIPAYTYNAAGLHRDTLFAQDDVTHEYLLDPFGQRFEQYQGSFDRFDHQETLIRAYHTDYDLLTFVQKWTPIPDAVGREMPTLDTPFDFNMAFNTTIVGASILTGTAWLDVYATLDSALTMVEAHGHPAILYGLLVEEGTFGTIVKDALGYSVYFP